MSHSEHMGWKRGGVIRKSGVHLEKEEEGVLSKPNKWSLQGSSKCQLDSLKR